MKKLVSCLLVLVCCISLLCPVMAEGTFVPSISYKEEPEVVPDEEGNYGIMMLSEDWSIIDYLAEDCLLVTPISEIEESEEIPEEEKAEILEIYEKLSNGTMKIPYTGDFENTEMVIRDLFDARLICDEEHREKLAEEGVVLQLTFDLGLAADAEFAIMIFCDGEWVAPEKVTNNGDGTVTIVVEDLGLIAVSVPVDVADVQTGDDANIGVWAFWASIMVVCLVAFVVILRKFNKNHAN